MNIYIASSWKNKLHLLSIAESLRSFNFNVDLFCDDSTNRYCFNYEGIKNWGELNAKTYLDIPEVQKVFKENKKWLDWCDVCLLVLPAGKSSHLESGYAVGSGKHLVIYHLDSVLPKGDFDAMNAFANFITTDFDHLCSYLWKVSLETK